MFDKGQNSEKLNKIMGILVDKQEVLSYDNEETNNIWLEEEICQQINLIKLKDLDAIPLEEIRRKSEKQRKNWWLKVKSMRLAKSLTLRI